MQDLPETRESLLLQVKDPENLLAWEQFVAIYRPVIFRTAVARGLQHADADDLAQRVLFSVAKAIPKWEKRNPASKFRHWLARVTRNAILNWMTRQPLDRPVDNSYWDQVLEQKANADEETESLWRLECRRELFFKAAQQVQSQLDPETWAAFELTTIKCCEVADVARELGKSTGAIYAARSRVMRKLRDAIQAMEPSTK